MSGSMFGPLDGSPTGGKLDWKTVQEIMRGFRNNGGPLGGQLGAPTTPTLSGGPSDGFHYTPTQAPNVPFQNAAPINPQLIPRGGNLGLPSGAPMPAPMPAGQSPTYNQAPGTTMAAPMARPFNGQQFNLGLGLMQHGGAGGMARIAQYLPSIFGKK